MKKQILCLSLILFLFGFSYLATAKAPSAPQEKSKESLRVEADSLLAAGRDAMANSDYLKGRELFKASAHVREGLAEEETEEYVAAVINLALSEFYLQEYAQGYEDAERALSLIDKINVTGNKLKALALRGKFMNAMYTGLEKNEILELCKDVIKAWETYAAELVKEQKYQEAIFAYQELLKYDELLYQPKGYMQLPYMLNLLQCYSNTNTLGEALPYIEKAIDRWEMQGIKPDRVFLNLISNAAYYNQIQANYQKAIDYYQKWLDAGEELGREDASILANLASCYNVLGNYDLAKEYAQKAVETTRRIEPDNLGALAMRECMLADVLMSLEDYQEALVLYEKNLNDNFTVLYEYSPSSFWNYLINLAICYKSLGDMEKYLATYHRGLSFASESNDLKNSIEFSKRLALAYQYNDDFATSQRYAEDALKYFEKSLNDNPGNQNIDLGYQLKLIKISNDIKLGEFGERARALSSLIDEIERDHSESYELLDHSYSYRGGLYRKQGKLSEALEDYTKALENCRQYAGETSKEYAATVMDMGSVYKDLLDEEKAKESYEKARVILEGYFPTKNLAILYNDLGNLYFQTEELDRAIEYYQKSVYVLEKLNLSWQQEYGRVALNIANIYMDLDSISQARKYFEIGNDIYPRILEENHPDMVNLKILDASLLWREGKRREAQQLSAGIFAEIDIDQFSADRIINVLALATDFFNLEERYSESLQYSELLYKKALEMSGGKPSVHVLTGLKRLAEVYSNLYDYQNALIYSEKAYDVGKKLYSPESVKFAALLSTIAEIQNDIGNTPRALELQRQAVEIYRKLYGEDNRKTIYALFSLAAYNLKTDTKEAIKIYEEIKQYFERTHQTDTDEYQALVCNLSICFIKDGQYEKALALCQEALENLNTDLFGYNTYRINLLSNIAEAYYFLGELEKGEKYALEALNISEQTYGKEGLVYLNALRNLSSFSADINPELSAKSLAESTVLLGDWLRNNFAFMTNTERSDFWGKYQEWYDNDIHRIASVTQDENAIQTALSGSIFSKALLLKSEMEFEKAVSDLDNADLREKLNTLFQLKSQLISATNFTPSQTDSILKNVSNLEREILSESKKYQDFTGSLSVEWQQVRNKLGKGSTAVEFVTFTDPRNQNIRKYAAYIFDSDSRAPKMVNLFDEEELKAIGNAIFEDASLSEMIWKKIEEECIKDISEIYFTAAGDLHVLPIESIRDWKSDAGFINERIKFHRLMNLWAIDEIQNGSSPFMEAEGIIYGGIDYGAIPEGKDEELKDDDELMIADQSTLRRVKRKVKSLPASMEEAEEIHRKLDVEKIPHSLLVGKDASEESFRRLSGQGKNFLHIATHGYYLDSVSAAMPSMDIRLINSENRGVNRTDLAMSRSGLLFAGANAGLRGEIPDINNDGVLSGLDISRLNLDGLKFVVLSACQTGLGEISGEGVSGLQRAFKRAGAQSMLISLWWVDDEATRLFMERFYQNLLDGQTPSRSLSEAQDYLKKMEIEGENPYSDPLYWAPFILLDSL